MIQLYYIVFCLALAWINYKVIAASLKVFHAINGLLHLAFWIGTYLLTKSWFPVAALPFIGRVVFDGGLSIMRGLPFGYVSQNPKSITDKMEQMLFDQDGIRPKLIYIVIVVILNIVYYV